MSDGIGEAELAEIERRAARVFTDAAAYSGLGEAQLHRALVEHLGVLTRRNGLCARGHGAIALTLIEVIVPDNRQPRLSHGARPVKVPIEADVLGERMKFFLGVGCEPEPRGFI